MYNFVVGNNKSSAQKWLRPAGQEEFDDDFDEYDDYRSYRNSANRAATGTTTSGPVKIINNQQTLLARPGSASQNSQKQQASANSLSSNNIVNSTSLITRPKTFDLNIFPKRLALSYQIPTIIIEYLVPNSGKLYHHKIKIRELKSDSDKEKVLKQIKRRHEMYLTKIADKQLLSLIENLQKNIKNQQGNNSDKEPQKPKDMSGGNDQNSGKKASGNIINPFSKSKNIADSQISMEEKELCAKLKNQFGDDEDDDDFGEEEGEVDFEEDEDEDDYYKQQNKSSKKKGLEEDDNKEGSQKEKKVSQDEQEDYDYDFDEYTDNDNSQNISKPFSQDISQISNSNNDVKIPQKQQAASIQKELIDAKLKKEYINAKPATKQAKIDYDDGIEFSDLDDDQGQPQQVTKGKTEENEMEESDGYRDFDVDAKAIYQHQFSKNTYSHKIKTQEEYSDDQDEQDEEEYGEGEEGQQYDDDNNNEEDDEQGEEYDVNQQQQEGDNEDDDDYDLEDIDNLKIQDDVKNKVAAKSPQKNNFMEEEEVQQKENKLVSSEKKQLSEDKAKTQVKFEQTLSSKKPEMQMKTGQAYGGFIAKKNNFVDADEGIDLSDDEDNLEGADDDLQMDFTDYKNKQQEEEDYDEDEEDLYQQVKKKLGNIQQKDQSNPGSDYKNNLQQKKYDINYYQQKQNEYLSRLEDDKENDDDDFGDDYDNEEQGEEGEEGDEDYGEEGEEYGEEDGEYDENQYEIDDIDLDEEYQVQQANLKYKSQPPSKNEQNAINNKVSPKQNVKTQKSLFDDLENELEENLDNLVDYDNFDLNKLNKKDLDEHKKVMDRKFEQNRKKPGDKDFVYDVRESFEGNESNHWDISQSQDKQDMEQVDYDIV